jgi:raffinose/stachyose/melibiose transport system substrate-binding protein
MQKKNCFGIFLTLTGMIFCFSVNVFAGGGQARPADGSSARTAEVSLLLSKNYDLTPWQQVFDEIEKRFNIKTNVELRVVGGEGETIVKTRLATGDMTDILYFNTGSKTGDINPARNCLDISSKPFASRLIDSFKLAASVDGKLYAVPATFSTQAGGILYNKKIYKELGLQIPLTWNDFLSNCAKIQNAGKTALIGAYKDTWTAQIIFLSEEYYIKQVMPDWPAQYTANKAGYSTVPAALRSFEKLAESAKYLNKDYLSTTLAQALEMLATGQGAHFPMLTIRLAAIEQDYPEFIEDIGVFAQPGDDPNNVGITAWMPEGLYINKASKNIEAAEKWLDFWTTQEAYDIFSRIQKPTGPSVIKGISLPTDVMSAVKDIQKYFDSGKVEPALEFESPVKGPGLEQFCIEVVTGRMTPKEAAAAYDLDVQKQAKLLNLPGW